MIVTVKTDLTAEELADACSSEEKGCPFMDLGCPLEQEGIIDTADSVTCSEITDEEWKQLELRQSHKTTNCWTYSTPQKFVRVTKDGEVYVGL